jgi:Na+/H+-dicarboxylate symporter
MRVMLIRLTPFGHGGLASPHLNLQAGTLKHRLFAATILALVLGTVCGMWLGPEAAHMGQLGKLVVRALKAVAVPMLFFAILSGVLSSQLTGKGVKRLVGVAGFNALCALVIALSINHLFNPGTYLKLGEVPKESIPSHLQKAPHWTEAIGAFIPESFLAPFIEGSTTGVILLAILLGLALKSVTTHGNTGEHVSLSALSKVTQTFLAAHVRLIEWLVLLVPIGVFGSVAQSFSRHGMQYVYSLGVYLAVCLGGLLLQMLLVYQGWVLVHPTISLASFWRVAKEPLLYAFGVNSSLATMPMTLKSLAELGVKEEAARLSACVGTNFNNDGILLYEVAAGMMLAQSMGMTMGFEQQLLMAGVAVVATVGVSGFPEAGLVALTLVLTTFGIPTELIVSLLAVDWIVGRFRSATNILGDMAVAIAIDRGLDDKSRASSGQ